MKWEKYKWYIIGYVFYASIVIASTIDDRDFWQYFIVFCITIPIALYIIIYLFLKYKKKDKTNNPELTNEQTNNEVKKSIVNTDLVQSWSLLEFAKLHGKMQVGTFENRETGESFKSCIFTNSNGETIYVSFYSKLGELTPLQIKEKKDTLKVGLLKTSKYVLYEEWESWEEVVI